MKMYSSENRKLAISILNEMFDKIDYEKFLDIFDDKFNWFAFLGITEEDYKNISSRVHTERVISEKEKVLTKI